MKKLYLSTLCLLAMGISTTSFGASNTCTFEGGEAKIIYSTDKSATVMITLNAHGPVYRNCKVSSDDFGKLIDCNTGNRDFMLLISKAGKPKTGGVMSNTLNLFKDLSC